MHEYSSISWGILTALFNVMKSLCEFAVKRGSQAYSASPPALTSAFCRHTLLPLGATTHKSGCGFSPADIWGCFLRGNFIQNFFSLYPVKIPFRNTTPQNYYFLEGWIVTWDTRKHILALAICTLVLKHKLFSWSLASKIPFSSTKFAPKFTHMSKWTS